MSDKLHLLYFKFQAIFQPKTISSSRSIFHSVLITKQLITVLNKDFLSTFNYKTH